MRRSRAGASIAALCVPVLLGGTCAVTDERDYAAGAPATAIFGSAHEVPIHLSGCAPFVIERRLGGEWVEQGPPFVCIWEGIALVLGRGESLRTPFAAPSESGTYRLRYEYGTGCVPDVSLSQAGCEEWGSVSSFEFEVERELCETGEPDCRFFPAAPNYLCEDGIHFSGPAAECTRDPSTGRCGYEFLSCP